MLWTTAVESSNLSLSHSSTFLTWEAGMGLAERAMMIVPAGLVENWRHELNDVFHLPKYERLSDERKNQIIEEGKRQMINEARRVACLMPDWIPAKRRGKEVRVSHTLPITFKLQ